MVYLKVAAEVALRSCDDGNVDRPSRLVRCEVHCTDMASGRHNIAPLSAALSSSSSPRVPENCCTVARLRLYRLSLASHDTRCIRCVVCVRLRGCAHAFWDAIGAFHRRGWWHPCADPTRPPFRKPHQYSKLRGTALLACLWSNRQEQSTATVSTASRLHRRNRYRRSTRWQWSRRLHSKRWPHHRKALCMHLRCDERQSRARSELKMCNHGSRLRRERAQPSGPDRSR